MAKRKICFTDIDGTLTKSPLHVLLCEYAVEKRYIPAKMYNGMYEDREKIIRKGACMIQNEYAESRQLRAEGNKKSGKKLMSSGEYNRLLVRLAQDMRNSIQRDRGSEAIAELYSDFSKKSEVIYDFTENTLDDIYETHDIVAVSKSDIDLIKALFEKTGYFKDFIATKFKLENGIWIPRPSLARSDKGIIAKKYANRHNYSFEGSIGLGDSPQDVSMLELVAVPIIVQPDPKMLDLVLRKGWSFIYDKSDGNNKSINAMLRKILNKRA